MFLGTLHFLGSKVIGRFSELKYLEDICHLLAACTVRGSFLSDEYMPVCWKITGSKERISALCFFAYSGSNRSFGRKSEGVFTPYRILVSIASFSPNK